MKSLLRLCAASMLAFALHHAVLAGSADISNVPLGTAAVRAKPNIMFILDDSGSMASEYMPDDMSSTSRYGYYSSQCNGLAYNPATTYELPLKADGTTYPSVSFTAAPNDGYNSASSTTNLTNWYYYSYTGTQPVMSWTYTSSGSVNTTTTFYTECRTRTSDPGPFTRVTMTSASSDAQNYANWYSYYRNRLMTMRSAVGRAFASLDSNYRVGFTMISDSSVTSTNFLDVRDFDNTQKTSFYGKLYNSYSGSWTPLRAALSKVGRYYGNVASGQSYDPMQYSCQRNFAILSTDGYWNDQIETSSYGPFKLDGSTNVGQQDGSEARPMKDSGSSVTTVTTRDPFETTTVTVAPVTTTYTGRYYDVASTRGTNSCAWNEYYTRRNSASCAVTWDRTTTSVRTDTSITTTVTTDGVTAAPTNTTTSNTTNDNSPSSAPACPSANWVRGSALSNQCYTSSQLSSRGASPGTQSYDATGSSDSVGTATSTSTSTNDPAAATTTTTTTSGGDSNSLADVAEYYYKTDLRTDLVNDLEATNTDTATYQHLNTYTVGLGVKGTLSTAGYDPANPSGDYAALIAGTKNWPVPSGTTGGSENATHIDDLWHAAVNGRGLYFSAGDPSALTRAISTTLAKITEQVGSGAAAAASTLTPTVGDDWIFLPSYIYNPEKSVPWSGDLRAFKFTIDTSTGAISLPDTSAGNEVWSARSRLDARNLGTAPRLVRFNNGGTLADFTYANLSATQKAYFDNRCTTASVLLTQCSGMAATPLSKVTGTNMVAYLTGDTTNYLSSATVDNRVFRSRSSRLGDFVNASPVYVSKPPFKYADSGYAAFVSAQATRTPVVYAAGNDGMLHAFKVGTGSSDATGGTELWAFVPSAVIPELWRLADSGYDSNHRYYVDATPAVGDVFDGTHWRTILVGGLGGGGRAYYALDVTDPVNPSLLWEIDTTTTGFGNLGLTYGNPIITKNASGTWVVVFTSGLNNIATGDGVGRLYVVNAVTGAKISEVSTATGSGTTPSNLARIEGWVASETNNTTLRFYAGDMLGNLWRFDYDDQIAPSGNEALKLGIAQSGAGAVQPITSKPVLSEIAFNGSRMTVVSFGTGRYLGTTDTTDTTEQSIYSVRDSLGSTGLGILRNSGAALVEQTLNSSRTMTSPITVDWATKNGWFVDLDRSTGERVFVDGIPLGAGSIAFTSLVPGGSVCYPTGTSYLYRFSLLNGTVSTVESFNQMIVGLGRVVDPKGNVSPIITLQNQSLKKGANDSIGSGAASSLKRTSWREIID